MTELPEAQGWCEMESDFVYYTADQMREYAKQAVLAEREACAEVAERGFKYAKDGYQIADAIRARSQT